MKRYFLMVSILAGSALACHHAAQPALVPQPNADSLALERARQDSMARALADARAKRDSLAAARRADSLLVLRRRADSMRTALGALIHFNFDKAVLMPEDVQLLDQKTSILEANPGVRIQIAGNCDERGSDEYNLALGNRRAIIAKTYLVNHGIAADRIETVSYGKERPIDPAHNEDAWAKDRNDQFVDLNSSVVLK
ncbi:MAG TPA: OmpA family protein [Gemmatimonadales bacterium]|nr:OmpA family protein [Gemmatimonadales bacterium]